MRVSPTSKELFAPNRERERRDCIPGFVTLPRMQTNLVSGNVPPRIKAESSVSNNNEETLVESSLGIDIEEETELETFCTKSQELESFSTRSQDDCTKSQDDGTRSQDEDAAGKSLLGVCNAEFSQIESCQTELTDSYGHPRYTI